MKELLVGLLPIKRGSDKQTQMHIGLWSYPAFGQKGEQQKWPDYSCTVRSFDWNTEPFRGGFAILEHLDV